ncbi:MAG: hypothetical protein AAF961_04940, partial [Planctomycetota bacterium]
RIRSAGEVLQYRIFPDASGQWHVYDHVPGYFESIGNSVAALSSVLFIATVLAFLLLLVHVAGLRWEAAGRLTYAAGGD